MPKQPIGQPVPDEYGRLRVRDLDTGHERTIPVAEFPHGNYLALDEPASHPFTSDPLPVKLHESLSSQPNRGLVADSKKENTDA
ncbi:MAG: hypothetical protein ACRDTJ_04365 [Pseudonocardiaceae bacterium]